MTLSITQDGWGYAAVTKETKRRKQLILTKAAFQPRGHMGLQYIGLRLTEAWSWHFFYNHCGRRKTTKGLNGDWLLKYLSKGDTTTSSQVSWAKLVTWLHLPSKGVGKGPGDRNIWWIALETATPHDMQQCVARGSWTPLFYSGWVCPGLLAAEWGQPIHCSGSGCWKDLNFSLTHFV